MIKDSLSILSIIFLVSSCGGYEQSRQKSIKRQQYMIQGKMLYEAHCMNCHQIDGSGLGELIPPMDSGFIQDNFESILCGIKYGMKGKIIVNGIDYNGVMPANKRLTILEISELATFISHTWSSNDSIIDVKRTKEILKLCH